MLASHQKSQNAKPLVVFVNEKKIKLTRLTHYEKAGRLYDQEAEK